MVTKDAWRVEAPPLIRAELEKRLPSEFKILRVEPDSFYHEGREVRYVNVIYTGADPYGDYRLLNEIDLDIYDMLWERGYYPVPGFEFQREETNLV